MNEVTVDISGTIVSDPVLRRTKSGDAFLSFRVAVNERRWKAQENTWADGDTHFFSVTAFRTLAGNAYHSIAKGQPVMVSGRLRISQYTNADGEQRTSVQIDAHDIGTSLKFGQTTYTKCASPQLPTHDRLADEAIVEVTRELEAQGDALGGGENDSSQPQSAVESPNRSERVLVGV